jgi:hypothetical protein
MMFPVLDERQPVLRTYLMRYVVFAIAVAVVVVVVGVCALILRSLPHVLNL